MKGGWGVNGGRGRGGGGGKECMLRLHYNMAQAFLQTRPRRQVQHTRESVLEEDHGGGRASWEDDGWAKR